ncbi:hypothetical protein E2986_10089 [Frieseomelitta varia]|uniref:Uncharacterized protein n=1 Tax=Frieseomelitta varia TaxID=561572 RepID=A0A833R770_9HYME|nr:hypothetical protein E2986_10089 [Frieseomelitta varia]
MDTVDTITIDNAIKIFTSVMCSLSVTDKNVFLSYIADKWKPEQIKSQPFTGDTMQESSECTVEDKQVKIIKMIANDIRKRVPMDGTFPLEEILPPTIGENSDCDKESTKHVDAFLYDNRKLDELIENGEVVNIYCADCLSENVRQYNEVDLLLDIISHSLSLSAVLYIFHSILPSLQGKFVLDIGSRLGPVLYGVDSQKMYVVTWKSVFQAYVLTSAEKIIGVEMNRECCLLQHDIINKYNMNDRIEIVNKRIEECPEIVQTCDVIIMNNPFEFYASESVHREIWKFLIANIQSGTILVTKPSIETIFKNLKIGPASQWVKSYKPEKTVDEFEIFGSVAVESAEHEDIKFYERKENKENKLFGNRTRTDDTGVTAMMTVASIELVYRWSLQSGQVQISSSVGHQLRLTYNHCIHGFSQLPQPGINIRRQRATMNVKNVRSNSTDF